MHSTMRRSWLKNLLLLAAAPSTMSWAAPATVSYPAVTPRPIVFPRDFGAHPEFRTEWWYMTGWCGQGEEAMGFQVTFFRSRTLHPAENPSRFAPQQLMFAHAALARPVEGQLRHAEISGRAGPAGAAFDTSDTAVQLSGWSLQRTADDHYKVWIPTDQFTLALDASAALPPVLRGVEGFSAKGPSADLASFYYSRPQLNVSAEIVLKNTSGNIRRPEQRFNLSGSAWFDHEWSSSLLMPGAVGWDWIGINLFDGSHLMAFRIRNAAGQTLFSEWDWRDARGNVLAPQKDVRWEPVGQWRSSKSMAMYPLSFTLRTTDHVWTLEPLMRDQEVDARASTGGFYYEGAVKLKENGQTLGRGYLELTGYGTPLAL